MRSVTSVAAALVLACGVAGAVVLSLAADAQPTSQGKIRVAEVLFAHHEVGLDETFRTQVHDRDDGTIGYGAWACTHVSSVLTLRECVGTLSLPGGQLMVQGALIYRTAFAFAVVGGTGRYNGALGIGTSIQVKPRRWNTTLWIH
jgi:hypothetical protein